MLWASQSVAFIISSMVAPSGRRSRLLTAGLLRRARQIALPLASISANVAGCVGLCRGPRSPRQVPFPDRARRLRPFCFCLIRVITLSGLINRPSWRCHRRKPRRANRLGLRSPEIGHSGGWSSPCTLSASGKSSPICSFTGRRCQFLQGSSAPGEHRVSAESWTANKDDISGG